MTRATARRHTANWMTIQKYRSIRPSHFIGSICVSILHTGFLSALDTSLMPLQMSLRALQIGSKLNCEMRIRSQLPPLMKIRNITTQKPTSEPFASVRTVRRTYTSQVYKHECVLFVITGLVSGTSSRHISPTTIGINLSSSYGTSPLLQLSSSSTMHSSLHKNWRMH